MERYAYKDIKDWVNKPRRKPLLFRGTRQVRKTWLGEAFGKQVFDNFLKIDFEESPAFQSLFDGDLDPKKICSELEIRTGIDINEKKTLLFFNEIQACPRAIIALRYFYEKMPDLHIVVAGSLLELVFSEISFPVGRIQPMNFSEFLLALGYTKAGEFCNSPIVEASETTHEFLIEQLRVFWLVGGMPECVKVYVNTKSIKSATEVQDEIIETYQLDFNKYRPRTDISCLKAVFSSVAARVGMQIKYNLARIANKVKADSSPGLPMEALASDKKFMSIFLDVGLMNRSIGLEYNEAFIHRNLKEESIVFLPLYFAGSFAQFGFDLEQFV